MKLAAKMVQATLDHAHKEISAMLANTDVIEDAERLVQRLLDFGAAEHNVGFLRLSEPECVIYYQDDAAALLRDIDAAALLIVSIGDHGTPTSKEIRLDGFRTAIQVKTEAYEALSKQAAA